MSGDEELYGERRFPVDFGFRRRGCWGVLIGFVEARFWSLLTAGLLFWLGVLDPLWLPGNGNCFAGERGVSGRSLERHSKRKVEVRRL